MKGDLAMETIIRLVVIIVVTTVVIQLIISWYNEIKGTSFPSLVAQPKQEVSIVRGRISDPVLEGLVKNCYDRFQVEAPQHVVEDCYVVQSDGLLLYTVSADFVEKVQTKHKISVVIGDLNKDTAIISYNVATNSVVIK
ncbi:MAG: hypothetical protein QW035_03110 [Candidatus Anstonellales archaeon]